MTRPSKRLASRSLSPDLPPHYLPSFSTSSSGPSTSSSSHQFQIQAYEATLIDGYDQLAQQIESTQEQGGRMARWTGSREGDGNDVWIDRYDILNLVPSLPSHLPFSDPSSFPPTSLRNRSPSPALSDTGFSDLASDHEEEFYFRQLPIEEREALEKKRKRRKLELGREERMKQLEERERAENPSIEINEETEPSDTQLSLMQRLHSTLSTAQNPSLLELRILTNHSSDPKFQFLKKGGKWREIWERIRRGEKIELRSEREKREAEEKKDVRGAGGLAGLGDYGSSDSESDEEEESEKVQETKEEAIEQVVSDGADATISSGVVIDQESEQGTELDEEERRKKEAKAEKVREWARKRQEAREGKEGDQ